MIVGIYIGEERCDLFEDENIQITSSVLDVQDITKNTGDYSNSFTVPASDVNNKIFKHYYNANIDNTFDARVSVDARIELDNALFRYGKILLTKVNVKSGRPYSYSINFFGNNKSLKDLVGDDYLSDLDLSAYDHDYTDANVKNGLTNSLFDGDLVYTPLVKKQYYYNSDETDTTTTDTLTNIAWGNGSGSNGIAYNELKPSLRLARIIEAIEAKYGITFSRDFLELTEFYHLFLWLNNREDNGIGGGGSIIDWDGGSNTYIDLTNNIGYYTLIGGVIPQTFQLRNIITPTAASASLKYTVSAYQDGTKIYESKNNVGKSTFTVSISTESGTVISEFYWVVSSDEIFNYEAEIVQRLFISGSYNSQVITIAGGGNNEGQFKVSNNIPKIKTIDFLKGLFNAFKLVLIPKNDGTYYLNSANDFYKNGIVKDFTNYIDAESVDISRGSILNTINFEFKEPQTILNKQFDSNNGNPYGNEDLILKDESGQLLSGGKVDYSLPFEQVVYERLIDLDDTENESAVQYGAIIDTSKEPVNIAPHIHYVNTVQIGSKTIGFVESGEVKTELTGNINLPSHSISEDNPNYSFIFSQEFSTYNSALLTGTLYKNYHQSYIEDIFNIKRRNFKYKAHLPLGQILNLKLNDVIFINEDFYRIDKFTTNLITGLTNLDLVNSFDYSFASFTASVTDIKFQWPADEYYQYVTNLYTYTSLKVDVGYGVDWLTVSDNGAGNVIFTVTENTGYIRAMQVVLTKDGTGEEITFSISQKMNNTITCDNDIFTCDSTLITI